MAYRPTIRDYTKEKKKKVDEVAALTRANLSILISVAVAIFSLLGGVSEWVNSGTHLLLQNAESDFYDIEDYAKRPKNSLRLHFLNAGKPRVYIVNYILEITCSGKDGYSRSEWLTGAPIKLDAKEYIQKQVTFRLLQPVRGRDNPCDVVMLFRGIDEYGHRYSSSGIIVSKAYSMNNNMEVRFLQPVTLSGIVLTPNARNLFQQLESAMFISWL